MQPSRLFSDITIAIYLTNRNFVAYIQAASKYQVEEQKKDGQNTIYNNKSFNQTKSIVRFLYLLLFDRGRERGRCRTLDITNKIVNKQQTSQNNYRYYKSTQPQVLLTTIIDIPTSTTITTKKTHKVCKMDTEPVIDKRISKGMIKIKWKISIFKTKTCRQTNEKEKTMSGRKTDNNNNNKLIAEWLSSVWLKVWKYLRFLEENKFNRKKTLTIVSVLQSVGEKLIQNSLKWGEGNDKW